MKKTRTVETQWGSVEIEVISCYHCQVESQTKDATRWYVLSGMLPGQFSGTFCTLDCIVAAVQAAQASKAAA